MRGTYGAKGRVNWHGTNDPAWRRLECPVCKARIGWSCVWLNSWVEPVDDVPGFYARVRKVPHPERRAAATSLRRGSGLSPRGVLRKRIGVLAMDKLTGSQRVGVRAWAGDPERTEEELAAKVAELETMSDLAW